MDFRVLASTAGASFGVWPIIFGLGHVNGVYGAAVMALVTLVVTGPISVASGNVTTAPLALTATIVAGAIQTLGIIAMSKLAETAPAADLPRYMGFAFIVQLCVPVVGYLIANAISRTISLIDLGCFALILIGAYGLVGRAR